MKLTAIILVVFLAPDLWGGTPKQIRLDSLFLESYYRDDTVAMRKLLKQGADIYAPDQHGLSPLHWAFLRDSNIFKFFLRQKVKITRRTPNGMSLLHLIASGQQDYYNTPYSTPPELIAELLASKNDVRAVRDNGRTPLHEAAMSGNLDLVQQLIEHGADVNARDTNGATPLHFASHNSSKLLPKGWTTCGNGWEGREKIRLKTVPSRQAIIVYLIDHGADVNAIDNRQNLPLHWYAYDCIDTFVHHALPRRMRVDVINEGGETVLHTAAESSEDGSAVNALIAAGVDINARDNIGRTPIFYTLRRNRIEAVKLLLAAGADITIKDQFDHTVYYEATQSWQRPEISALLRDDGAVLETTDPPKTDYEKAVTEIQKMREKPPHEPTELELLMEEVQKLRKK